MRLPPRIESTWASASWRATLVPSGAGQPAMYLEHWNTRTADLTLQNRAPTASHFLPSKDADVAEELGGSSGTAVATVSSENGRPCLNSRRAITPSPSLDNSSNRSQAARFN